VPASSLTPDPAAGEHAFRDGLHALLAGDPRAAVGLLDRACAGPAGGIEDSCYWAAVAWLRVGDRPRARRGFDDFLIRWPVSSHAGEASVALGWLLVEAGEPIAARVHFAAALNDPLPDIRREAARGLAATAEPPGAKP
jgi:TolA-binding protein